MTMNQLSENAVKEICFKFFKQHQWERINYVNHSRRGYCPIIILSKDTQEPLFQMYDNLFEVLDDIRKIVDNELRIQGGYSNSFYLSLEDIDNLNLQQYVVADSDVEKVLNDAKNAINY